MKINLIPPELQPTRPSLVPYLPLLGLAVISLIWLVTQFISMGSAQVDLRRCREESRKIASQLAPFRELPARTTKAEQDRSCLRLKAAAVTVLTRMGLVCSDVLVAFAESLPANLRITDFSVDSGKGTAILLGYGSEETADIEVTTFVRQLNNSKVLLDVFSGARLNFCNSTRQGEAALKKFSILLQFREERLRTLSEMPAPAAPGEGSGKKNGHKT